MAMSVQLSSSSGLWVPNSPHRVPSRGKLSPSALAATPPTLSSQAPTIQVTTLTHLPTCPFHSSSYLFTVNIHLQHLKNCQCYGFFHCCVMKCFRNSSFFLFLFFQRGCSGLMYNQTNNLVESCGWKNLGWESQPHHDVMFSARAGLSSKENTCLTHTKTNNLVIKINIGYFCDENAADSGGERPQLE